MNVGSSLHGESKVRLEISRSANLRISDFFPLSASDPLSEVEGVRLDRCLAFCIRGQFPDHCLPSADFGRASSICIALYSTSPTHSR